MSTPQDNTATLEDLREQTKLLKTVQEKFIYACTHGSDDVSLELCGELVEQHQVKLDKIIDKKNGNLSLMHILAMKNKPKTMELLAFHKLKIDSVDNIHATPLLHAASNNCAEACAFLLSKGANINARDTWGKFPLLVSLKNKHYKVAEVLAAHHGIDVHLRAPKGNTLLHILGTEGDLYGMKLLIEQCGASPQRRNNDEENVLQVSLAHTDVVQYLCSKMDQISLQKAILNVDITGHNIVHESARNINYYSSFITILKTVNMNEFSAVKLDQLLNSPDKEQDTPLILAVKSGNTDMVRFLCQCDEMKINMGDVDGNTALYHAAALKNKDMVDMMTSVGATFNADNKVDSFKERNGVDNCMRSLKTWLTVLMAATAIISVVTIAAISIGFFASNVVKSTKDLRSKYFEEVLSHITKEVSDTTLAHKMSFNDPGFNVTNYESTLDASGPVFINSLELLPLVNIVSCAMADGRFATWIKNTRNSSMAYFTTNYKNIGISNFVTIRDLKNYRVWSPNDTAVSVYRGGGVQTYTAYAKSTRDSIWTHSYTSRSHTGEIYLTLTRGQWDPVTDKFLGSCQFDFLVRGLSTYLEDKAKEQANSVSVILEASTGYLIGASDLEVNVLDQLTNVTIRYDDSRGNNTQIDALLAYARSEYGGKNLTAFTSDRVYDTFYYNGKRHVLNIGRIKDKYGLHWIVLQGMPLKNFYGRFNNSIIVMCCATLALLILGVVIAVILATLFMRPILMLIEQTESIKLLQLEQVEKHLKKNVSFFSEIHTLQQTFEEMTNRLKQFRNFIPDHILAVIEEEIGVKKSIDADQQQSSKGTTEKTSDEATNTESINGIHSTLKNMVNTTLNSSLVSGNVTVMTIKFPDFAHILELHDSNEIDETSKELLSQFMDIIRIAKGQFVSVSSSKAIVAFNTFIKQQDHRIRACKVALKCLKALKKLHVQWKVKNLPVLDVTISITSDVSYYGNMGTDRMKFFTLVGPVVQRASSMCKNAPKWGVSVIVDQNVYNSTKGEYHLRPLYLLNDENNTSANVLVYELGETKSADAWVNEIESNNNNNSNQLDMDPNNIWKEYNDAYKLFDNQQYDEAFEAFVEYLAKNAQDVPAQNMLGLCKQMKEELGSSGGNTVPTDPTASIVQLE
jgi:ankyrin repeat protein/class 3 adenylate cyclase